MRLSLFAPVLTALFLTGSAPSATVTQDVFEVRTPMADGVELVGDLFLPDEEGDRFPVVLIRGPYGRGGIRVLGDALAAGGYAVVIQDVRGTGDSGGEFRPMLDELADGRATLEWLEEQDFCNGEIGLWGASYLGYCALMLAAEPSVDAVVNVSGWAECGELIAPGDAVNLMAGLSWCLAPQLRGRKPVDWTAAFRLLPVMDIPEQIGLSGEPWRQVAETFVPEEPAETTLAGRYGKVRAPILHMTGWYDYTGRHTFEAYERLEASKAGGEQALFVGPWIHDGQWSERTVVGDEDFGPRAAMGVEATMERAVAWFDRHLKGRDPVETGAARVFVMGENAWREFDAWPPSTARHQRWYLSDDLALSTRAPSVAGTDSFLFDPDDPVPTYGGANAHDFPELAGVRDQSKLERRADVLVYRSPVLTEDLLIVGPLDAVIHAATTGRSADFTAKLVELRADGYARIIDDGIRRELAVEPGAVTTYEIDLGQTAILVPRGSRLALEVSSSNFPKYSRNAGTGEDSERAKELETVEQVVHFGPGAASHVTLPVVPLE